MPYLLDTNHCIYLQNGWLKKESERSGEERNTVQFVRRAVNDMPYMSEVTLGELYYGAEYSRKREYDLSRIETLRKAIIPLEIREHVWKIFGETKALLRKEGNMIPDLDLLIAATAKSYDLTLVTHDKHLEMLPDSFKKCNWAKE